MSHRPLPLLKILALLGTAQGVSGCGEVHSGTAVSLGAGGFAAGDFNVPVRSMADKRFDTVIRQQYDFSCGSAALATLLRYHYGGRQDEEATFRGMWAEGDRAQIRKVGFSLLDMKRYLAALGYSSDGFQVGLDEIAKTGIPGIVLVNLGGYKHFVVVKGVNEKEVLVGDPALGLKTMSRKAFLASWNGVYFVVNDSVAKGRSSFNSSAQWASYLRAPIGGRFLNPVSQQALLLTAPFYRDF